MRTDSPTGSPAFQLNPSLVVIDADANPGALAVPDLPLCISENDGHLAQIHFTSHHSSITRPPVVEMADADRPFQHLQPLKPNLTQERGYEVYATLVRLRLLPRPVTNPSMR